MIPRIAVLTFPGNNCENETVRALKSVGFAAQKIRWNEERETLLLFDGVVIPGGFSFEDRGRSGVVSAQEPIFQTLKTMAKAGKPIMGICNGAQMLVESGLILETAEGIPSLALLKNKRINEEGEILGTGFYHSWSTLKPVRKDTPFSDFDHPIHIPIAHGEGRFTVPDHLHDFVKKNRCIVFEYVNENGEADPHYPINPNGSFENAAAMCNPSGNVMAIMPHPERADSGKSVFSSLWNFFLQHSTVAYADAFAASYEPRTFQKDIPSALRILVSLNITDNTEKTFSEVLKTQVSRKELWDVYTEKPPSFSEIESLLQSGELVNLHKQSVQICVDSHWYQFSKEEGFTRLETSPLEDTFLVREHDDMKGQYASKHISAFPVSKVSFAVVWKVSGISIEKCIQMPLFASYTGEYICR